METRNPIPNSERLSILTASILLAYAVSPYIKITPQVLSLTLGGAKFFFQFDFSTITSLVAAALAFVGSGWLISSHPRLGAQKTLQFRFLPALTAWVIGVPLNTLSIGPDWWGVLALGALLLLGVFTAEYFAVDFDDYRYPPAAIALLVVSFGLFLLLVIAIRAAGLRLYLLVPAVVISLTLMAARIFALRLGGNWQWIWAAGVSVVVGQAALGLHYLPISPLAFGLVLLGLAFGIIDTAGSLLEGKSLRSAWPGPLLVSVILWGLALQFG